MDPLEMEGPPLDAGEGDVSGVANAHEAAIKVAGTDEAACKILRALKTSTLDWAEDGACTLTIVGTDGVSLRRALHVTSAGAGVPGSLTNTSGGPRG